MTIHIITLTYIDTHLLRASCSNKWIWCYKPWIVHIHIGNDHCLGWGNFRMMLRMCYLVMYVTVNKACEKYNKFFYYNLIPSKLLYKYFVFLKRTANILNSKQNWCMVMLRQVKKHSKGWNWKNIKTCKGWFPTKKKPMPSGILFTCLTNHRKMLCFFVFCHFAKHYTSIMLKTSHWPSCCCCCYMYI
jgi:hypothetical protein